LISYNKIMGQLQDAGNTTTLAHYVSLLETAFLVSGLQPYARQPARRRVLHFVFHSGSPVAERWHRAV
jgi:predicted AAA+ superfamily ATPase